MNDTTLEVGQGLGTVRGYVGVPTLALIAFFLITLASLVATHWGALTGGRLLASLYSPDEGGGWLLFDWFAVAMVVLVGLPMVGLVAAMAINDVFGYVDASVRFDRVRRKVYVWASRKEGPIELDWNSIKPVAQSQTAPPYQLNSFRSVLLVDEDEYGNVRFEGKYPRVAQIGAAVLNREHTLAAYEYVRVFMERGPQELPAVETHLVWRPRMPRQLVDIFGVLQGFVHAYPRLPSERRKPGWLVFFVVLMTLLAPILWPLQLAHALSTRTTRLPRWPQRHEELAAIGGPMLVPRGSVADDMPMLPHERIVAFLWVGFALVVYAWLAWSNWR
ncbi:MAG: hypothetical protein H7Y33_14010 [Cytophagales bacterium]|nr:hypothetical protein [Rhizobacter sp.]